MQLCNLNKKKKDGNKTQMTVFRANLCVLTCSRTAPPLFLKLVTVLSVCVCVMCISKPGFSSQGVWFTIFDSCFLEQEFLSFICLSYLKNGQEYSTTVPAAIDESAEEEQSLFWSRKLWQVISLGGHCLLCWMSDPMGDLHRSLLGAKVHFSKLILGPSKKAQEQPDSCSPGWSDPSSVHPLPNFPLSTGRKSMHKHSFGPPWHWLRLPAITISLR